jgi:hypothetical protein
VVAPGKWHVDDGVFSKSVTKWPMLLPLWGVCVLSKSTLHGAAVLVVLRTWWPVILLSQYITGKVFSSKKKMMDFFFRNDVDDG